MVTSIFFFSMWSTYCSLSPVLARKLCHGFSDRTRTSTFNIIYHMFILNHLQGICVKETQELVQRFWSIIDNITPDRIGAFMRANLVGTVIILSLIIWIPVSCIIGWQDRKAEEREKERPPVSILIMWAGHHVGYSHEFGHRAWQIKTGSW